MYRMEYTLFRSASGKISQIVEILFNAKDSTVSIFQFQYMRATNYMQAKKAVHNLFQQ